MKKTILLIVAVLCLVMNGCTASKSNVQTQNELAGTSLEVVTSFGEGDGYHDIYVSLLESFQDATGAVLNDRSSVSDEMWKKNVILSFDTGDEPDVLFFFTGSGAESFIADGKVVDIETIRAHRPNYAMNINLGVLTAMKAHDGLNYCVPVTGFWEGMFINTDLFEQHGVKVPSDINELYTAIDIFRQASITPIAIDIQNIPHYWFEYLLFNYNGPSQHLYTVPDASDAVPESWVNGLAMFKMLYEKKAFPDHPEDITEDICLQMFNNKEAAMLLTGSWTTGAITDSQNVKVVPVPAVDPAIRKPTDIIGGFSMGFYITKKAWDSPEKKEAAIRFVEWMTNENALSLFNAGGAASPGPVKEQNNVTPLIMSGRAYADSATAFIPAVQDTFTKDAREYLFSEILYIARGESDIHEVIQQFITLNAR